MSTPILRTTIKTQYTVYIEIDIEYPKGLENITEAEKRGSGFYYMPTHDQVLQDLAKLHLPDVERKLASTFKKKKLKFHSGNGVSYSVDFDKKTGTFVAKYSSYMTKGA